MRIGALAVQWVLLGLVISSSAQALVNEDAELGWARTKVGMPLVYKFTRELTPCYDSYENYLSCVHLVSGVTERLEPALTLLPEDIASVYPEIRMTVRQKLDKLILAQVEHWGDAKKGPELARQEAARRELMAQAVKSMFENGVHIEFENLVEEYLKQLPSTVSPQRAIGMALNRMIQVQDAHGHLDPLEYENEIARSGDRAYPGIGVTISQHEQGALIDDILEGSSAEKAKLQVDDVIIAVDGKSMRGGGLDRVVASVRGPEGTMVKVTVKRRSEEQPITVPVTRFRIQVQNLKSKKVQDLNSIFHYIKLSSFKDDTACDRMREQLSRLPASVKGIILDLRGNGGGSLDQSVCISGLFVGRKLVVTEKKVRDGVTSKKGTPLYSWEDAVTDLPLIVLINEGSASASEIVSGAIRDHGRGWLLGTRTFGKATVQSGRPWSYDGRAPELLRFETTHRFYQPSGLTNQIVGIEPDFEFYRKPNPTDEEKFALREAELAPSALPSEGERWQQGRPVEKERLSVCLGQGLAENLYETRSKMVLQRRPDFQLYKAEEMLSCMVNLGIH